MKITLKQAFSMVDGRLSTNIDDVYKIINYTFKCSVYTHQLPSYFKMLKNNKPQWFIESEKIINHIKHKYKTNDFEELMSIIDEHYVDFTFEL